MLSEALDKLVERNVSNRTREIEIAIREKLIREGLWPPSNEGLAPFA